MWKATARGLAIFRGHKPYYAKHNQYAKHANAMECGGITPGKF